MKTELTRSTDGGRYVGQAWLLDWLREIGADPHDVFAVRLVSEGAVEVDEYERDERGSRFLAPDCDDTLATRTRTLTTRRIPEEWPL